MLLPSLCWLCSACSNNSIRYFTTDGDQESLEGDLPAADGDGATDGDEHEGTFTDSDSGDDGDIIENSEGDVEGDQDDFDFSDGDTEQDGESAPCRNAILLRCGDRFDHDMAVQGEPDEWYAYSCTQRFEGGRETVYSLQTDASCRANVRLTNLHADIDLMLLNACDPWSCVYASSTPLDIQHEQEELRFGAQAGQEYLVVVDGYAQANGGYTISVDCACEEDDCLQAGGSCNDYADTCSMGTKRADTLHCDLGVCCLPQTCAESGGTCFAATCPGGWRTPRWGEVFTCENDGVCCTPADACPDYLSALAQCPYQYVDDFGGLPACPDLVMCRNEPCMNDADCPQMDSADLGGYCVTGNCVYCWQDSQCPEGALCRGGRCVRNPETCPSPSACTGPHCALVELSESPCPVCVCDTVFDDACQSDETCQPMAHHYFAHCVYGRCAECRNDDECQEGVRCLPPGLCYSMTGHPALLYGSWLIGWRDMLKSVSYFRFEPDGTLRRGAYPSTDEWWDSVFLDSCGMEPELPHPLIGTWEPEMTQSGFFIIRVRFQTWCATTSDSPERFMVRLSQGGSALSLVSVDHTGSMEYYGWRVDPTVCAPDFSVCAAPGGVGE